MTLGSKIAAAVIFDRDYRSGAECAEEQQELEKYCDLVRIHDRKEVENFVLVEDPIRRAIESKLREREQRTGSTNNFDGDIPSLLEQATGELRHRVESRFLANRRRYEKSKRPSRADTSIDEDLLKEFEETWDPLPNRLKMVPGKEVLGRLNQTLQDAFGISVSVAAIISSFRNHEIPPDMAALIEDLDEFCRGDVEQQP